MVSSLCNLCFRCTYKMLFQLKYWRSGIWRNHWFPFSTTVQILTEKAGLTLTYPSAIRWQSQNNSRERIDQPLYLLHNWTLEQKWFCLVVFIRMKIILFVITKKKIFFFHKFWLEHLKINLTMVFPPVTKHHQFKNRIDWIQ